MRALRVLDKICNPANASPDVGTSMIILDCFKVYSVCINVCIRHVQNWGYPKLFSMGFLFEARS